MPIGDIFDENFLGQIQQQGRQDTAEKQAIQQILLPALLQTDPNIRAQGPVQPGQAPPTADNPQFEALVEQALSGGRQPGPLGRLEQTTGGGILGDVGRFALGAVGDTIRGGPVGGGGLNEELIRALADANQGNRQRDVQASRSERSFETDERIRQAKATPGRVPETAQEKQKGKFDALAELKKTNPELFERVKPPQKPAAKTKVKDRITEELAKKGFFLNDFGQVIDARTLKPPTDEARIREVSDAIVRGGSGGQFSESISSPSEDPGGPVLGAEGAQALRDRLSAEMETANNERLRLGQPPLTREEKLRIAQEVLAQQGGAVGQ